MTHVESANQYIADVLSGTIPACDYVRRACQRQVDDLKESKKAGYPYRFDVAKAERVCKFLEVLPHTKGIWAARGETIKLEPWQQFIFTTLFGWVKKKDDTRRFREAYIEVPRKNGKSIIGSGVGLYMFAADHEYGAEVFSGASSEKQAWEVFRPAKLMMERDVELREALGVQVNAKTINRPADMSRFEPIIGKPGDGSSPSCAIADEFHEHQTDEQVSTMLTGMGARTQPLMLYITTSGFNLGGPCYSKRTDVIKILEGTYEGPDVFGVIYTIDQNIDWTTPEALRMANPNFGVSVLEDFLLAEQRKAIQSAHLQNNFKTKHLNIWCSASAAYFNMQDLEKCADKTLSIEDFHGEECMTALDVGSKIDISGLVSLFRRSIEGKWHYYAFTKAYIPEETAWDPKNKQYQAWANEGLLTVTDGNIIDYDRIETDNLEWCRLFRVLEEAFDPWNAAQFALRMANEGVIMVEVPQNVRSHSAPMKELDALIRGGRFHYDGSPILKWMFSNVVAKVDANDNVFPRKERNENKIDLVVAIIMALGRWMVQEEEGGSDTQVRFI